jgi:hypothetical protein
MSLIDIKLINHPVVDGIGSAARPFSGLRPF